MKTMTRDVDEFAAAATAEDGRGMWIGLRVDDPEPLAELSGAGPTQTPDEGWFHCTLLHLGRSPSPSLVQTAARVVADLARRPAPTAWSGGAARFCGSREDAIVLLLQAPEIRVMRQHLAHALHLWLSVDQERDLARYDYTPHVTLSHAGRTATWLWTVGPGRRGLVRMSSAVVVRGEAVLEVPLVGGDPQPRVEPVRALRDGEAA